MQRFILVGYIGKFIPNLYKYHVELNKLTHKNNKFVMNNKIINIINQIKDIIKNELFLYHPDFGKPFYLITDASKLGMG